MESQYYYNKWTPGRALGHCKATLSCARDNSRALAASPWPCTGCQWLHLLKSTYIWKQLCSKKPKPQILSTVHPITAFSRQRDPKDHQNMLKSRISTASKGKHRSSCCCKNVSLNLDHQKMAMAHPETQQELQRHAGVLWGKSSVQWPSTQSRLQAQQVGFEPSSKGSRDSCC